MIKILFIASCLFFIGCSSESEDDKWIQPMECVELLLQKVKSTGFDPECTRKLPVETCEANLRAEFTRNAQKMEKDGCIMRKTACTDGELRDNDIKCECERNCAGDPEIAD